MLFQHRRLEFHSFMCLPMIVDGLTARYHRQPSSEGVRIAQRTKPFPRKQEHDLHQILDRTTGEAIERRDEIAGNKFFRLNRHCCCTSFRNRHFRLLRDKRRPRTLVPGPPAPATPTPTPVAPLCIAGQRIEGKVRDAMGNRKHSLFDRLVKQGAPEQAGMADSEGFVRTTLPSGGQWKLLFPDADGAQQPLTGN